MWLHLACHWLLPKVLHPDETRALIAAADCSKPLGLRDAAMVEVLYGAGLRVSELVGLPLSGVDLREGWLRVIGKGQKERVVPLGEAARSSSGAIFRASASATSWGSAGSGLRSLLDAPWACDVAAELF